jgi:hypothetical protein
MEGEFKRAAHTITDATTGLLMTAASHTPLLQYAVNTYVHRSVPLDDCEAPHLSAHRH